MEVLKQIARQTLPVPFRHWLKEQARAYKYSPPLGRVNFGSLRRVKPISPDWGFDRGSPVDRYYVEQFLSTHAPEIRGHVLEVEDSSYTHLFGGDRITKSDVLHIKEGNPNATMVGDLTCPDQFVPDTFDCIILTQTLQLIYNLHSAVSTVYRILKPGGVVLVTVPGITQISHYNNPDQPEDTWTHDTDNWSDCWYWNFTTLSAKRLFEEVFGAENVEVEFYGNVLAATALLYGLARQEVRQEELDYRDLDYQVIITVRAVKPDVTHSLMS